ncbi:SRPBCC family protein [Sphingomonas sp. SFZ2018-12]|uniref:SRPBCC family protein n=1 Tax=Sphingomonas sp. SFZ2018-12 TaxID=2683197 RepID=UPI001F0DEAC2|nr:SRPBCC family protein [Sphingomonas sp. SFZ2018-12]MCH4892675.1 SRPBCC family protein [Sphingomonas sp. SFZ2018-12]
MDVEPPTPPHEHAIGRVLVAFAVAAAFLLGVYVLVQAVQPGFGVVSFTFLLILPAAVTSFICYVGDPLNTRPRKYYHSVPLILMGLVVLASIFILHEGTICILMLSPLWMTSSFVGATATRMYRHRHRHGDARTYSVAMLALPLVAMQVEPYIPLPQTERAVTRSIVVSATPAQIWPLLEGIPDVRPDEGGWNLSQDVIGIPRPVGAQLLGAGVGAQRIARWENQIRFREIVTEWQPGRRLSWRFVFDDLNGWAFTDRHLMPKSPYFRITTGGYRLDPVAPGRTRVTLTTRYWMQTAVNDYSSFWGEFLLGDVENNLLALVKQRAEGKAPD